MKFPTFVLLLVAAFLGAACVDAPATSPRLSPNDPAFIINGTPTGSAYGAVGALAFDFDKSGTIDKLDFECSGSLIAPTVFLTAAHCLAGFSPTAKLWVTFAPDLAAPGVTWIEAQSFNFDSKYGHDAANSHDVGVVILPAQSITPLQLPPAEYLTLLAAQGGLVGQVFVNVGYGSSASAIGPPSFPIDYLRRTSQSVFLSLRPLWLVLSMNAAKTALGGDCYGDSGSPKFLAGNPNRIVAITVTGDLPCRTTSIDYRLDTSAARTFLSQYVTLP